MSLLEGCLYCILVKIPRRKISESILSLPRWHSGTRIHLPMQEVQDTRVRPRGREDPLEEGIATHSSILAWEIPWAEEPGGLSAWGHRVRHDWAIMHALLSVWYLVYIEVWEGRKNRNLVFSVNWGESLRHSPLGASVLALHGNLTRAHLYTWPF